MFNNKKTKHKITLILCLILTGFIITFFLANYVILMLGKEEITLIKFLPHTIMISMIKNNFHFMIFISFSLLIVMCVFLLLNSGYNENFTSELDEITDNIKTPRAVGQMQHGSARWLDKKEYDKIFDVYLVSTENSIIKSLSNGGLNDKKTIANESIGEVTETTAEKDTEK